MLVIANFIPPLLRSTSVILPYGSSQTFVVESAFVTELERVKVEEEYRWNNQFISNDLIEQVIIVGLVENVHCIAILKSSLSMCQWAMANRGVAFLRLP